MMPGIGFAEMVLLALVAVVVIGPKDLPLMARKFGRFTGKMRAMAFEFKQGFDELGRQAELEELRKEVAELKKHTGLEDIERDFNEDARKVETEMHQALNPPASTPETGERKDEPLPYPGLSADDPGYETGEDYRIHHTDPPPAADVAPPAEPPVSEPAKQDTPA